MPIEVDPSEVHSIEVDASAVSDFDPTKKDAGGTKQNRYKGLADYAPSWAKGLGEAVDTASNVLQKDLGNLVGMIPGKIGKMGKQFAADLPEAPATIGGAVGKGLGGFMEYETAARLPGVSKLTAGKEAGLLKRAGAASAKAGVESGVVGTAQTGDVSQGARQAAFAGVAAPVLSEGARALSPVLKKSATRLYERFLTPGGGTNYNKAVAKNAAEHLIKEGHFAMTKGGFLRHAEQNVMDANTAIEKAEDEMLEKMGYAPTGRSTFQTKAEPFTEHVGPTIDVDTVADSRPAAGPGNYDSGGQPRLGGGTNVPAVRGKELGRPRVDPEGTTRSGTRYKTERVGETEQGMLYVQSAIDNLKSSLREHGVNGEVIAGYGSIVKAKRNLIAQLERQKTPSGYMSARDAIKLRRAWDELVNWERNPNASMSPGVKDAYEKTANALRHEIAEQVDGMKEANAKYHFWAGVNKVLKDTENRHTGHRPLGLVGGLLAGGAGIAGTSHGGVQEGAELALLVGLLSKAKDSGANLTGSAIVMDRIGDLLHKRNFSAAINRMASFASPVARSNTASAPN